MQKMEKAITQSKEFNSIKRSGPTFTSADSIKPEQSIQSTNNKSNVGEVKSITTIISSEMKSSLSTCSSIIMAGTKCEDIKKVKEEVKKNNEVAKNSGSVFVKFISSKSEKKENQGIPSRNLHNRI